MQLRTGQQLRHNILALQIEFAFACLKLVGNQTQSAEDHGNMHKLMLGSRPQYLMVGYQASIGIMLILNLLSPLFPHVVRPVHHGQSFGKRGAPRVTPSERALPSRLSEQKLSYPPPPPPRTLRPSQNGGGGTE